MMNKLGLGLTTLWMYGPFYRLADDQSNKLCQGAGICSTDKSGNVVAQSGNQLSSPLTTQVKNIIETLLTVAGAVAVIIIVIGGIRYITSTGDATRIKQAKETVMYAVVGLIVTILAYAIVHFVANSIQ